MIRQQLPLFGAHHQPMVLVHVHQFGAHHQPMVLVHVHQFGAHDQPVVLVHVHQRLPLFGAHPPAGGSRPCAPIWCPFHQPVVLVHVHQRLPLFGARHQPVVRHQHRIHDRRGSPQGHKHSTALDARSVNAGPHWSEVDTCFCKESRIPHF